MKLNIHPRWEIPEICKHGGDPILCSKGCWKEEMTRKPKISEILWGVVPDGLFLRIRRLQRFIKIEVRFYIKAPFRIIRGTGIERLYDGRGFKSWQFVIGNPYGYRYSGRRMVLFRHRHKYEPQ